MTEELRGSSSHFNIPNFNHTIDFSGVALPHLDRGNVQLFYLDEGKGDPVVLVHGLLGDYRSWGHQVEIFSQSGHRAVAYSRRNHYPNPWVDYPPSYTLRDEADDLAALIRGLGLQQVNLIGSSFGGSVAALAARDNPELLRSLVLIDPGLRGMLAVISRWDGGRDQIVSATKGFISSGKLEDAARTWYDFLVGRKVFDQLPSPMRAVILQNVRPLLGELSDSANHFTGDDAKKIELPTLLISGESSPAIFHRIINALAECIPGSKTLLVPVSSHSPQRQNPTFFNDAVLNFIRKI